jgi:deoxycytidylate deaminase
MSQIIIGLTGPFGSGTKIITEYILKPLYGAVVINLSGLIKESDEYKSLLKTKKKGDALARSEMQDLGDDLRAKHGNDILAKRALDNIHTFNGDAIIVIRGIKNIEEVKYFRHLNNIPFYLFAVTADVNDGRRAGIFDPDVPYDVLGRKDRVINSYKTEGMINERQYELDEERDRESKDESGNIKANGQQVLKCYQDADIIIDNSFKMPYLPKAGVQETTIFTLLKTIVTKYTDYILIKEGRSEKVYKKDDAGKPKLDRFVPTQHESSMVMAYANSLKSMCIKRKVGAIITNGRGDVISSGYNEVPRAAGIKFCKDPNAGGACGRDVKRREYIIKLKEYLKRHKFNKKQVEALPFDEVRPKLLEECRALHAEERAMLSLATSGIRLDENSYLYATTFTCNLCANKVVEMGIKNLVYSEPYPVESAKSILYDGEVNVYPYQGVTHKGYFRLMEDNE